MLQPSSMFLVSTQDGIVVKAHIHSASTLSSHSKTVLQSIPVFVWLNADCSWCQRVECRPLTFSTPLSSRQSILWFFSEKTKVQSQELICYIFTSIGNPVVLKVMVEEADAATGINRSYPVKVVKVYIPMPWVIESLGLDHIQPGQVHNYICLAVRVWDNSWWNHQFTHSGKLCSDKGPAQLRLAPC